MKVADGGFPPKSATAVLIININYNLESPEFDISSDCTSELSENQATGETIDTVYAIDADRQVCTDLLVLEIQIWNSVCIFEFQRSRAQLFQAFLARLFWKKMRRYCQSPGVIVGGGVRKL